MKKNIAGQIVGVQMTDAADGSPFTGSVVAYVTGDNGTQATGSVGSGACVHKGNGLHTYAPAQAETNYDHVVFTFVGTGAIVVSVQVYTEGVALDAAGVRAAVGLASANLDTQLDALPTAAENTTAVWAAGSRTLTAIDEDSTTLDLDATIRGALGMAAADLDTQIDTLATAAALATAAGYIDTEVAAIKAKTDNLPADPADASDIAAAIAGLDIPTVDEIWDEAVDGSVTARQSMRLHNSAMGGKASGLETTTAVYRDLADTKDRVEAVVDANGNRTTVILDLT